MRSLWHKAARRLVALAVVLAALATLAGLLEGQWWGFHLFVHFPLQMALVLAVLIVLAMSFRLPYMAGLAGLSLLAQVPALSWSFGLGDFGSGVATAATPQAASRPLVVTTFNMGGGRVDEEAFLAYLDEKDPDILLLQESYRIPKPLLARLAARFDHFGPGQVPRRHSRMIFSRTPIPVGHRIRIARRNSFLVFQVELGDRRATVITLHAANPTWDRGFEARNKLFKALKLHLPNYEQPIIVAGDFNTTSWSRYFQALTEGTELRDAAKGQGWVATWPARLGDLGIGIDHILVSDDIEVAWIASGPNVGSDHLPVTAWLRLAP
ncbi:MAG: endonuclease/exonuclease/phosphatase family protein [Pseudomonadota bacterium]